VGSTAVRTSPPMMAFPLSMQACGGSGTMGLTNIVLEVEGMSEVKATYPSPVLSVGLFRTDSIWSASHQLASLSVTGPPTAFLLDQ
jgi:hypothetical protein